MCLSKSIILIVYFYYTNTYAIYNKVTITIIKIFILILLASLRLPLRSQASPVARPGSTTRPFSVHKYF